MSGAGKRAGGIVRLEACHDGDTYYGNADAKIFTQGQRLAQDGRREESDKDWRSVDQREGVRDGGKAERGDVENKVQGRHQPIEQETGDFLPLQTKALVGEQAHAGDKQGGDGEPPESDLNRGKRGRPAHKDGAG